MAIASRTKLNVSQSIFSVGFFIFAQRKILRTALDIFDSILNEADKIEKALLALDATPRPPQDISSNIHVSLSSLENVLEVLVKNTDSKTNEVNPEVLTNIHYEEVKMQLEKIRLLTRRIERALIIDHETLAPTKDCSCVHF